MKEETRQHRTSITFSANIWQMLLNISEVSGWTKGRIVRLAILMFHFVVTKISDGWEVKWVHRETGHVIELPTKVIKESWLS